MPNGNQEIETPVSDRLIKLGRGTTAIPERLLLAHAKGQVLFVTGAGISMFEPAGLPDFRGLALGVYKELDPPTYEVLSQGSNKERADTDSFKSMIRNLNNEQRAEILRFCAGDYDVVLGMLERRLDRSSDKASKVRASVGKILRANTPKPAPIHRALMRLADRGGSTTIVTTNFDLLLEDAARSMKSPTQTYALGGIPRPTQGPEFGGIMHIHGALDRNPKRVSDLVLTDRDLGEFYLRRRIVPDLIYDAARLYNLVLVGYSANDPPMRYLLNAVAADRERFSDLKERFVFIGFENDNPIELEDWKARGLTPIQYNIQDGSHVQLEKSLRRWAELSAINGNKRRVDSEVRRITRSNRIHVSQEDRDVFDHFTRRSNNNERRHLTKLVSDQKSDIGWLDAIMDVLLSDLELTAYSDNLGARNRDAMNCVTVFLWGRLEEKETIRWALKPTKYYDIYRSAILELLDAKGANLSEPWRTAWRMIEESWTKPAVDLTDVHRVDERLVSGERTWSLVAAIVALVEPGIELKANFSPKSKRKQVREINDLLTVSLTSGDTVDLSELGLSILNNEDLDFMISLANALDAAVTYGLDIGRRCGWSGDDRLWWLGELSSVYYLKSVQDFETDEPDARHNGIAPSVKLLHEVVDRLSDIDTVAAVRFVRRWKTIDDPVHLRLWAALSRDPRVTPAKEVGEHLLSLNDRRFWLGVGFPEIAELRARRFNEFDSVTREAITARICKGIPLIVWHRKQRAKINRRDRLGIAIGELKRIKSAGGKLTLRDRNWMKSKIAQYPELKNMNLFDMDYSRRLLREFDQPKPDGFFDGVSGVDRLRALEEKLTANGVGPSIGALTWIRNPGNAVRVLDDFATLQPELRVLPSVLENLVSAHSPLTEQGNSDNSRELMKEASLVIDLLFRLPETNLKSNVQVIADWLFNWKEIIVEGTDWVKVWHRLWPIVQEISNDGSTTAENHAMRSPEDGDLLDFDTLNTLAGKLVEVFLAACLYSEKQKRIYSTQGYLLKVRDEIAGTSGITKFTVLFRLTRHIGHFLEIDREWTEEHLIEPLRRNNGEALALWKAIGRTSRQPTKLLELVGQEMTSRAMDGRLDRLTRRHLAHSVIRESLHAFFKERNPAIDNNRIQQMIRSVDVETRAYSALMVRRILPKYPKGEDQNQTSPEIVFRKAIKPFLDQIWPKERSLVTPGVAEGFASLPAAARGAFAEAVDLIDHLLVPFDCRSLYAYGLRSISDKDSMKTLVDDAKKAKALLRLLDRTIGTTENAVFPYELGDALEQISKTALALTKSRAFRRLETLSRR